MSNETDQARSPYPIEINPTAHSASPVEMDHPVFYSDVPFWKPSWLHIARAMGWRWIYFLPAIAIVAVCVAVPMFFRSGLIIFFGWWKGVAMAFGLAATAAAKSVKSIVNRRNEPFCIHCGYDLTGLADNHTCPECGRPFSFKIIEEYRRDPQWFIQRYRLRNQTPKADEPFIAGAVQRKSRDGTS